MTDSGNSDAGTVRTDPQGGNPPGGNPPGGEFVLQGLPASAGIVIGPAFIYQRERIFVEERTIVEDDIEAELELFENALVRADRELTRLIAYAAEQLSADAADIFETQRIILQDPELLKAVRARVRHERKNAEYLVDDEFRRYGTLLRAARDELLRRRAEDLDDAAQRLLLCLRQKRLHSTIEGKHVVLADNLTPADTVLFSRNDVLGYACDHGGISSHTAILARSLKMPAVVALQTVSQSVRTGDIVILDGQRGLLIAHPSAGRLEEYRGKIERIRALEESLRDLAALPSVTADGHAVALSANAEFINEIEYIHAQGSSGIGLYRTEHLYIEKRGFPSEQEQYVAYAQVAHMMYPLPVIIRSFDIGGDKYVERNEDEENPVLGWRGIRIMLDTPEEFRRQLRAILRASVTRNVKLMFPMISGVQQLRAARRQLELAKEELRDRQQPFDEEMPVGVMIEIPSAVFVAEDLARESDFFSIGTNDLVQYLLAVDRNNMRIASLYEEFHPAVLRAIKRVIDAGHAAGIHVGLCGEMAGNPVATVLLLGLGLDELSVVPSVIPQVKEIIRGISYADAQALAARVMMQPTATDVRAILREVLARDHPAFFSTYLNGTAP